MQFFLKKYKNKKDPPKSTPHKARSDQISCQIFQADMELKDKQCKVLKKRENDKWKGIYGVSLGMGLAWEAGFYLWKILYGCYLIFKL